MSRDACLARQLIRKGHRVPDAQQRGRVEIDVQVLLAAHLHVPACRSLVSEAWSVSTLA